MGQKINPTGFRLSVNRNWSSKWYANSKNFPAMLADSAVDIARVKALSYLVGLHLGRVSDEKVWV